MRVLVVHEGRFGAAVAARLAVRFPSCAQAVLDDADDPLLGGLIRNADVVLVASWRRRQRALDRIDALCHQAGIRWSAAVLDGMNLTSGPLVIPDHGPCLGCFWRRYLTHARSPQWDVALVDAYETEPSRGPVGFPPAAVGMAAAALAADAVAAPHHAGRVLRASLLGGDVLATRVVSIHGCERCGTRRSQPDRRFITELVPALEKLSASRGVTP